MKQLFKITLIFLFFGICLDGVAQFSEASSSYEQRSYQDAIKHYKKNLDKNPGNVDAMYNLANSYRLNREMVKAEYWYARVVKNDGRPEATLFYGQVLLSNGKYEKAEKQFSRYATQANNTADQGKAKELARQCKQLKEQGIQREEYRIQRVSFNSDKLDFSPAFYGSQGLVFASNREESKRRLGKPDPWTNDNFVDLFTVVLNGKYKASEPKPLFGKINSRYHEGPLCFENDQQTMYYTRSDYMKKRGYDKGRNTRLKIYKGVWKDGKWVTESELGFNDSEYSTAHPCLSLDDQTLIFASNRPEGYGGMDLYRVEKNGDEWGVPENLGEEINSMGNEVFPYLSDSGKLYFSSDMLVGIGGLDVFVCDKQEDDWGKPKNMGAPINSPRDDFGFIIREEEGEGYFSSNRNKKDDDIYYFKKIPSLRVEGKVLDCSSLEPIPNAKVNIIGDNFSELDLFSDDEGVFSFAVPYDRKLLAKASKTGFRTNEGSCAGEGKISTFNLKDQKVLEVLLKIQVEPDLEKSVTTGTRILTGQVIHFKYRTPLSNAKIRLINKCSGEIYETTTDKNGEYTAPVPDDCDYVLQTDKSNFRPSIIPLSTFDQAKNRPLRQDVELDFNEDIIDGLVPEGTTLKSGTIIELEHIYFDYDKYELRPDAFKELRDLLMLLRKYPNMKGEVSAHTDSRATYDYNVRLSQNRAFSVVHWLYLNGIKKGRITAKGYGENELRNRCSDGVNCSDSEHQRNRRVEFRVNFFDGKEVQSQEASQFRK